MSQLTQIIGIDMGLSHGSLVKGHYEICQPDEVILHYAEPIYLWTSKSHAGISEKSEPFMIFNFMERLLSAISDHPAEMIAIDYDRYSIFWKSRKLQGVVLALAVGYLTRGIFSSGTPLIFVEPREVRRIFKLGSRAEKELVHEAFKQQTLIDYGGFLSNEDSKDALILSYVGAMALSRGSNGLNQNK